MVEVSAPPALYDLPAVVIAVHTHRIVRATLDHQAAAAALRVAIEEAREAGIPPRVMRRALARRSAGHRALDAEADALLEVADSVAFGRIEPGA